MSQHRVFVMVAVALALATPRRAVAESEAQSPSVAAHSLGEEGLRLFQSAKWEEAYNAFRRAAAAMRAPTLVLYMGHCQARMGNLLAARQLYREVVKGPLASDAPLQFHTAQRVAREELRWIMRRLAVVRVSVPRAPKGRMRILVDGVEVPAADLDEIAVEPGTHVVEAAAEDAATARSTVTAVAGHTTAVELPLTPNPPAGAGPVEAASAAAAAPPPAGPRAAPSLLVPAGISLGVGGAALVAGAVTGALALRSAADVKSRCDPSGHCFASDQPQADSARRLGNVSTGVLVAGGVAVATGIVLATVYARRKATTPATGVLHVDIGLGYGAIGGAF